jgi:hypothetical protein
MCGFVVVSLMAAYVIWTNARLPKEIQRVFGPLLLMAIALCFGAGLKCVKRKSDS